jgi:gliding motility-associated-like protein
MMIMACWILQGASPIPSSQVPRSPASTCDLIVDAGPDTNVCFPGGVVGLMGSITGNDVFFEWTPHTGLSNPYILNPNANINGPITYTLTAWAIDPNSPELIVNGDFSAGNTGFSSDYTYVVDIPGNQMEMYPEGTYTVINNPNLVHNGFSACNDHTTGTGNMMVINGAANLEDIWCQTVSVIPNSYYNVSAWVASVNPSSPAILQFSINGNPIGNVINAPSSDCIWVPFNATWNSGSNTTATICILNLNTAAGGNDFALDDISMIGLCSAADEVEITLYQEQAPEPIIEGPSFLCAGEIGTYTATFPPDPPIYTYHWVVPGGASIISGQGTDEITILWNTPQETSLCLDIETRCDMNEGCYDVIVGTIPELPQIAGGTDLCPGESTTLYTPEQDPNDTYEWTLPPNVSLVSGAGTNEIEIEWASPGDAEICVAITNACGTNDNCTILSLYPNYNVLFDTTICAGSTFFINGHEYGNGILNGTEFFTTSHGCDSIVEVEVMEASVLTFMVTENLCPGDSIFLDGAFQNQSGTYIDSFLTVSGCDSIVLTQLIITPFDTTWLFSNTCDSTQAGIFITSYAQGNCDSTVIRQITYIPPDTTLFVSTSCFPADTLYSIVHYANTYGCDSVVITDINLLPSDTTLLTFSSCDPAAVGVVTTQMTNVYGCDSTIIATTLFSLSDTTRIHRIVCTYADTGTVSQLLTNHNGCDSLVINHAVYGGSDTTFLNSTTCVVQDTGWQFMILNNHHGCDSIIASYSSLLPSDATFLTETSCVVADTGVFASHFLNRFGCDSTVTLKVMLDNYNACHLEYSFTIDTPACDGDDVYFHLDLMAGEGPILMTLNDYLDQVWEFFFDSLGHYDLPWVGVSAAQLIFSSPNGIVVYDSLSIPYPHPLIIDVSSTQDYNGYSVPCFGDYLGKAEVKVYQNGTPPLSIKWSNGQTDQALFNLPAGWYTATVTDSHGCEKHDSILLTEPSPLSFNLTSEDLSCFGKQDGFIQLSNLAGGVPPLLTSLQGSPFNSTLTYPNLSSGHYVVSIMDRNGCELSDSATLTEPGAWSISLGPDTTIAYGTSLNLIPILEGTPQGNLQTTWSDGECDNCFSRTITPLVPTQLIIKALDENGCTSEDDIQIWVRVDRDLFIPNVFSPNGDQVNDVFLISAGPALEEINWLVIFDRWGDMVYRLEHFKANDPQYAWDGKKNGKLLNPEVFVYQLEVRYIDGRTEQRYGSITLVR